MSKVCSVIVNFNDYENAINLINELDSYSIIDEIVLVDNGSTDLSLDKFKALRKKKLKLIESENFGYAKALNKGFKYLNNKYKNPFIIASNTDIIIGGEDKVEKLISSFDKNVAVLMPKIKENNVYKYGWKLNSKGIDLLLNIPLINRLFRKKYLMYDKDYFKDYLVDVDVIYGCFFVIKGNILKEIKYMDENTFLYYEENILAKKLREKNYKSKCLVNVEVIHKHNSTIGSNISRKNKYKIYKKSQLYYEKEYNNAGIIFEIFFKIFYYINIIPYELRMILDIFSKKKR